MSPVLGAAAEIRVCDLLDVEAGSIFALLGSNGAGKTTAIRILSTLLKPDCGTVSLNGYDLAKQPAEIRRSLSLTGQFAAVDEILTGRENLVLVSKLRHQSSPGPIADVLARFGLAGSGGPRLQPTRVGCAAALT